MHRTGSIEPVSTRFLARTPCYTPPPIDLGPRDLGPTELQGIQGMKLFGYADKAVNSQGPLKLSEVTVVCTPDELRAIAEVLTHLASDMERAEFGHVHLADRIAGLEDSPQLIVMKAEA